jgi:hypothetical protein
MVGNDEIQEAIVTRLKADAALVAWLASLSAGDEIRENQWQGTDFTYPAVRIDVETLNPATDTCHPRNGLATATVFCFSEQKSSRQCNILARLVNEAMINGQLFATGFHSGVIVGAGAVAAFQVATNVWRAANFYRLSVHEST